MRYAFEAIIVNEFHTLNGTCASLVPSGPSYANVSLQNQVCTTVGSVAGQATVDGNTFASLSYGYEYANLWRNFGIIVAFGIAFVGALLATTEWGTASAVEVGSTLFVRSKVARAASSSPVAAAATAAPNDIEKRQPAASAPDNDAPPTSPLSPSSPDGRPLAVLDAERADDGVRVRLEAAHLQTGLDTARMPTHQLL
jgi:ATP-binding cassette, subfamily G (WHITE), member 2, SNQ2